MPLVFKPMLREYAKQVCAWQYPPPYDFYNMNFDEESIGELLNGDYIAAFDAKSEMIGFFCSGQTARVPGGYSAGIYEEDDRLDIGLGMKPSMTGKGLGSSFVSQGLKYIKENRDHDRFRLVVATFNTRAIRVYRHNGFRDKATFQSSVHGNSVAFLHMEN
jgi:ribosomal-protein-alanine N-acetyltransferase